LYPGGATIRFGSRRPAIARFQVPDDFAEAYNTFGGVAIPWSAVSYDSPPCGSSSLSLSAFLAAARSAKAGVRDALGKERAPVELEEALLHHAAHEVEDIDPVDRVAELSLEAVAVEKGQEELNVLFPLSR
jgi:hypothetical protein